MAEGQHLLVVEDDGAIREALAEGLSEEGFSVQVAEDGMQAMEMIAADRPALVLLDLMMPRMTGWQLLEALQQDPVLRGVPVFVVTAARYVGKAPMGYPTWVKPVRLEQIVRSIRTYLA